MKISDINPFIRYARIHYFADFNNKKEMSVCYDCRVFFIKNAEGSVLVNGKEYNISNKTAIYFPPESEYVFRLDLKENFNIIVLDFDLINNFSQFSSSFGTATKQSYNPSGKPKYELPALLSKPIIRIMPQIEQLLRQCTEKFLMKSIFFGEEASAFLKLCLLEFVRQSQNNEYSDLCEKVINFIHENYGDSTLTNEIIAAKFGYHPYHLSRIIKGETGKTLRQYLIYYRIRVAKNFLITTQFDLEKIAWKCGFGSAAYFIKAFRENTGTTPKKYRQRKLHAEL